MTLAEKARLNRQAAVTGVRARTSNIFAAEFGRAPRR
ncbi:hypothetical protein SAMN05444417_1747 [Wenxinia saemankumensis]|uniref:Uncharacterized protein n=1 Tax=Wenxinia saemankumensis TaxID=1447782 RepID=A0A1M6E1L3_9RHOB|nr:hypothetical protein SAMN05444417_1747 [Wenxinia saemankumensis]